MFLTTRVRDTSFHCKSLERFANSKDSEYLLKALLTQILYLIFFYYFALDKANEIDIKMPYKNES